MTDFTHKQPIYPEFAELVLPISQEYMYFLMKPYVDALLIININDGLAELKALNQWIGRVITGEHGRELYNLINNDEELMTGLVDLVNPRPYIDKVRREILFYIGSLLLQFVSQEMINQPITPWDLAKFRNTELTHLFGPANDKLTIIISMSNQNYEYDVTEEFAYGLLLGFHDVHDFSLFLMDLPLYKYDLENRFIDRNRYDYNYIAIVSDMIDGVRINREVFFDTLDFIQGVMTGAQWTNVDPHSIIRNLVQINNGIKIPMDF